MNFSFLNSGALFYKFFFFFLNFSGASSDCVPRFKAGSAITTIMPIYIPRTSQAVIGVPYRCL